ncbi:MAG: M24 family metallopeptidase [Brevinema sp.]
MHRKSNKAPVFEKRLIQLQTNLDTSSAFLTVNPADIYYLTGCTGSNNHLLVCTENVYLFTDGRYLTQVGKQAQVNLSIEEISVNFSFEQALKEILHKKETKQLKFTPDHMFYLTGKAMVAALPHGTQATQDLMLFRLRSIKDEMEIETVRQNLLITKAAYLYIQGTIKPGMTELEIATELEYYCKKNGVETMAFSTIIASGERSALPHGIASDKIIQDGDLIQFDFGIIKDHYCSDFSRVFQVGTIDPKLAEIREIVEDAVRLVEENARCGMTGQEIDAIARSYITQKGYGEYFPHGLGHGLGIEVHENPRLNTVWDKPIVSNMLLTIEPGIYLPGLGGIRLEDVVVMRDDKFEVLTDCSYDI